MILVSLLCRYGICDLFSAKPSMTLRSSNKLFAIRTLFDMMLCLLLCLLLLIRYYSRNKNNKFYYHQEAQKTKK